MDKKIEYSHREEQSIRETLGQIESRIDKFSNIAKALGILVKDISADSAKAKKELSLKKMSTLVDYEKISNDMNILISQAQSKQVSFDVDETLLEQQHKNDEVKLHQIEEHLKKRQNEYRSLKEACLTNKELLRNIENQLVEMEEKNKKYCKFIEDYNHNLTKLDIKHDVTLKEIEKTRQSIEKKIQECERLHSETVKLEIAFDSAQASALMEDLEKDIKKNTYAIDNFKQKQQNLEDWRGYFVNLAIALNKERQSAIGQYTDHYGPLASIIQKRLRPVYGFGDITLRARGGEIHVEVERNATHYRPIDYFSDSQNQIVMLSLFLVAGMSQTWSSFAPIMLDDPVTHFDDLNAYAFVELIKSIIDEQGGKRQFFISTCDERLYGLLRQRFQPMNERVRMYKFVSIGKSGPVIQKIH